VKAGIKKKVHNHMLRHGSATSNAKFLTESEMKVKYGWTGGSKMPAIYVHLSSKDLDEKLSKIYNGRNFEPPKPEFSPKICVRCGESNSPGLRFCGRCGTPLNPEEIARESLDQGEVMRGEINEIKDLLFRMLGKKAL
jgi:hypothetical protein